MHIAARMRFALSCLALLLALVMPVAACAQKSASPSDQRLIYLAHDLPDEELIVVGATLAAQREESVFLLDSTKATPYLQAFLSAYKPERIVHLTATNGPPLTLWRSLFERADDVVVCPARPRGALLQAACLAGALHAPLYVTHGRAAETAKLAGFLKRWHTRRLHLIGKAGKLAKRFPHVEKIVLDGEKAVVSASQKQLSQRGRIEIAVLSNPADDDAELGGMSALAPWLAVSKRAALLLTNAKGDNVADIVERALRRRAMRQLDTLLIAANLRAIPVWRRPNPVPGKDVDIEMEPLTPSGSQPYTFAVGRLFHADRAVVPLMLARQRLAAERRGPRKAFVASNSGGHLPLLETFSRQTIEELRRAGYRTTTLLGRDVSRDKVRRLMIGKDLFLWEGHSGTLIKNYKFPTWDEPLPGTFVFLQSCLSLKETCVGSLLSRGAVGVIGSSTRTYSGSGGACSLSFFSALLYEDRSVGEALRQSKNFLLAYSLLKEKRLGKSAARCGANLRSAWAFTLWGDPTFRLPRPSSPHPQPLSPASGERGGTLSPLPRSGGEGLGVRGFVHHKVRGNTIIVSLAKDAEKRVRSDKYQVVLPPNGRFGGLVRKQRVDDRRPLVPLVFVEVHLPRGRLGRTPHLSSRLPSKRWVFCWDERRRRGYLLAAPRRSDTEELRFRVHWEESVVRSPYYQPEASARVRGNPR